MSLELAAFAGKALTTVLCLALLVAHLYVIWKGRE